MKQLNNTSRFEQKQINTSIISNIDSMSLSAVENHKYLDVVNIAVDKLMAAGNYRTMFISAVRADRRVLLLDRYLSDNPSLISLSEDVRKLHNDNCTSAVCNGLTEVINSLTNIIALSTETIQVLMLQVNACPPEGGRDFDSLEYVMNLLLTQCKYTSEAVKALEVIQAINLELLEAGGQDYHSEGFTLLSPASLRRMANLSGGQS